MLDGSVHNSPLSEGNYETSLRVTPAKKTDLAQLLASGKLASF
jgi:hypothetical protein